MKSRYQKFGFTLVELIVVITILAILGTIAFMAFAGYSKNSRDSVRATDLSAIKTTLELFQMKAGFLPEPSGAVPMTYSGGSMTVWNQGTFGDSVMQNVEKLSKKPVDPLFGTEYTYSITNGKNEFEIGGVVEGDSQVSGNFLLNQANAQNVIQQALIQGNYNGKVLKVEMGGVLYIFALPSIITSDLSTVDVETQVLNKLLSYNGYGTIPSSFSGTTTSTADSFDFGGVGTNVVVFSGAIDDLQNINNLKTFTLNLQNAYSGSVLVNNQDYATLMAIDPENDNLINSEIAYLINNNLGGDITADTVDLSGQGGGGGGPENYLVSNCPTVNNSQNGTTVTRVDILASITNYIGCDVSGKTGKVAGFTYSGSITEGNKMVLMASNTTEGTYVWGTYSAPIVDVPDLVNISGSFNSNSGSIVSWDGYTNTQKIAAAYTATGITNTASHACISKGTGWYLPANEEIAQIYCYNTGTEIDDMYYGYGSGYGADCVNKGYPTSHIGALSYGDATYYYWTSNELNSYYARNIQFDNGGIIGNAPKDANESTLCVNRF